MQNGVTDRVTRAPMDKVKSVKSEPLPPCVTKGVGYASTTRNGLLLRRPNLRSRQHLLWRRGDMLICQAVGQMCDKVSDCALRLEPYVKCPPCGED